MSRSGSFQLPKRKQQYNLRLEVGLNGRDSNSGLIDLEPPALPPCFSSIVKYCVLNSGKRHNHILSWKFYFSEAAKYKSTSLIFQNLADNTLKHSWWHCLEQPIDFISESPFLLLPSWYFCCGPWMPFCLGTGIERSLSNSWLPTIWNLNRTPFPANCLNLERNSRKTLMRLLLWSETKAATFKYYLKYNKFL